MKDSWKVLISWRESFLVHSLKAHLWHRRASLRSEVAPAILCTGNNNQQTRFEWCTPAQTQQSSQTPTKTKKDLFKFVCVGVYLYHLWSVAKTITLLNKYNSITYISPEIAHWGKYCTLCTTAHFKSRHPRWIWISLYINLQNRNLNTG